MKKTTTELTTVPNFTFNQGDPFAGEGNPERPIQVKYYNGCIELVQQGNYEEYEAIIISPEYAKQLFKEIMHHLPDAEKFLKR